ncbi:MAG: FAD-dependent oxidoreductase [Clostridia bacterium]|nr:FAD-dependent oxidoreductase [Clostridia bacterium]
MPKQSPEVRRSNFKEVALGLEPEQAVREAKRCIQCKNRPCVGGCPVEIQIPDFVSLIAEGKFAEAEAKIKEKNSLPAICGRVCPQESQCESLCTLGKKFKPVSIGALERFVADWSREHRTDEPDCGHDADGPAATSELPAATSEPAVATSELPAATSEPAAAAVSPDGFDPSKCRVAVVGSGPAGLTCAADLAMMGYRVDLFESLHDTGGVLRYGIPEFRLPKAIVDKEVEYVRTLGVRIFPNVVVGLTLDLNEMLESGEYQAAFIGAGAGLPFFLGIPGENLNGVYSANEFLTRVNLMKAYRFPEYDTPINLGKRVAVVGAGNVAMDSARTSLRLGAEDVKIVYRRSRTEMPARLEEIENAEEEGVELMLLTNPTRIISDGRGAVSGMECARMELGEEDASGRRRPVVVPGSEFVIDVDTVIVAVGQGPNPLLIRTMKGLTLDRRGNISASDEHGATSIPGVWAAGDIVSGAATVISAMGGGKRSARGIDAWLRSRH